MEKLIEKLWDVSGIAAGALVILILGLILIKVADKIARRSLEKSTLDESV